MGRRKEQRTPAKLAVKLWGTDASGRPFIESVFTSNLSAQGASLEGVRISVKPGECVGLTYADKKARFRVTWVGEAGTSEEGKVGLENVSESKCMWELPLASPAPDPYIPHSGPEQRQFPRFECRAGIEVRAESSPSPLRGHMADISLGGCYVEMMIPLKVATKLDLTVWLDNAKICTAGMVTSSHPGFGVGIKFIGMAKPDRERLERYLESQMKYSPAMTRLGPETTGAPKINYSSRSTSKLTDAAPLKTVP
jgi:hypothetical protein